MDKMTFASYKFKPNDIIEGLNRYFAETKAFRYRKVSLEIQNGEVKPGNYYVLRNIVFATDVPKVKEYGYYYLICDPEEVVRVAINWLREECDIFYTPGMKIGNEDPVDLDIFDNPRYRFLSELSSELGIRTIVGPGNVEKTEDAIMSAVKRRNDELKNFRSHQIDEEGEEEARKEFLRKLRCYRDTCSNSKAIKERDAANDALFELRAKIREVYREVFGCSMEIDYGNTSALNDILKEFKFQKKLKEKAEEKAASNKMELQQCRAYILEIYREIFDCSNGDPEGSDKETLNDILEEYRNVYSALDDATDNLCRANTSLSNLKRQYEDEKKLVSRVRAERDSNKARRTVFLDKLAKILDVSYGSGFIPAKEQDILRAVETLSENYNATSRVLEDKCKDYDNLDALYKSSLKLLGEYLKEAKDILGIDSCDKDTVASAIRALKSAYNSLRNDYDEVCEGYTKLKKDYDELREAHSSVLKWNNSYADVRRLLEVPADADAGVMVGALNKFMCDYEKLKEEYEKAKCNTNNEQVGVDAFRNECRKLKAEKAKVIEALGQDIWDDCVK